MSLNLQDIIGNIFHLDKKEKTDAENRSANLQQKTNDVFATSKSHNPFLKQNGELHNPFLNYQKILDNPNISRTAKRYISQATGLTPNTVQTSPSVDTSSAGNTIADAAQKYIGTPYVWGGASMSEGGMDCSGFVHNALKDAGYNIGRTTAQGYRSYGNTVSKADLQPGDLIFYGKNGKASHIGIYIGNGQMIHSSGGSNNTKSNPGKGVSVANVDYRNDFIEARRY